jgi:hypothetical protein
MKNRKEAGESSSTDLWIEKTPANNVFASSGVDA